MFNSTTSQGLLEKLLIIIEDKNLTYETIEDDINILGLHKYKCGKHDELMFLMVI